MTKRLGYFDITKGVAIFFVVMGHVITMCIRDIDNAFIFKFIAQTHMPLFFFISGYFTYKSSFNAENEKVEDFLQPKLWKRFRQLIIPGVIMASLWTIYFPHSGILSPLESTAAGVILSPWKNGYWFPLVLFIVMVIYYVFSVLASMLRSTVSIAVTAVLLWIMMFLGVKNLDVQTQNIFSLTLVLQFFPIFMLGVFAKRHKKGFEKLCENGITRISAIIFGAISLYAIIYPWEFEFMTEDVVTVVSPVYHISIAIIAVILSKRIIAGYEGCRSTCVLQYLGQKSLEIYLLHFFFLFPLTVLQEQMRGMGLGFVPLAAVSILVSCLIIAATLLANSVISLSPFLSSILTGKLNSK